MSLKEGTDRDRSTLVEKNQHQRVTGDDGVTSRLRAANSITASTCSRSRPSNDSIISSMLAPAFRFSKMTETGMRVPLKTHAPLTFPGMLSTAGHLRPIERRHGRILLSIILYSFAGLCGY